MTSSNQLYMSKEKKKQWKKNIKKNVLAYKLAPDWFDIFEVLVRLNRLFA